MNEFKISALCLIAALTVNVHTAAGQVTNPTAQTSSRAAPALKIAKPGIAPHGAPRPTGFVPRTTGQSGPNLLPNYPVVPRSVNPAVASQNGQRIQRIDGQNPITIDPATRQNELRTLAVMRKRDGTFGNENRMLATIDANPHVRNHNPAAQPRMETRELPGEVARKKWHNRNDRPTYSDALRRHRHEWHDHNWWHDHCDTIVFVIGGYYFLDGSYWYPAYGYDPLQSYYDYDGPIYTYGNLLPDEVIANIQVALQDAGYYLGAVTGSLNFETRAALANFQRDNGLPITGAIDEATVESLGLGQSDVYQTGDLSNTSY